MAIILDRTENIVIVKYTVSEYSEISKKVNLDNIEKNADINDLILEAKNSNKIYNSHQELMKDLMS